MKVFLDWLDIEKLSIICGFLFASMIFGGMIIGELLKDCPK